RRELRAVLQPHADPVEGQVRVAPVLRTPDQDPPRGPEPAFARRRCPRGERRQRVRLPPPGDRGASGRGLPELRLEAAAVLRVDDAGPRGLRRERLDAGSFNGPARPAPRHQRVRLVPARRDVDVRPGPGGILMRIARLVAPETFELVEEPEPTIAPDEV